MNIDIDSLTIRQVRELRAALGAAASDGPAALPVKAVPLPFKVGDKILIRTVTMYQIGMVDAIGRDHITLTDASWVPDVGRLSAALANGALNEVERAPSWMMIGRGAIVDVFPWPHDLPKVTK